MWIVALVCNRLSKWHYEFTSKICDDMAWEGIQFIGKGLEEWMVEMQGKDKG